MNYVLSRSFCLKIDQELFIKETLMLAEELFKVENNPSNDTMAQLYYNGDNVGYNLHTTLPHVKSVNYGSKVLQYVGLKIWNIAPSDIKTSKTLPELTKIIFAEM